MGIDFEKLYKSRLEEVNMQISIAIRTRNWGKKLKLEEEKKELEEKLLKHQK